MSEKDHLNTGCCHRQDTVNNGLQCLWITGVYLRNSKTRVSLYFLRHLADPSAVVPRSHHPSQRGGGCWPRMVKQKVRLVRAVLLLFVNSLRHYGPQAVRSPASSPIARLFLRARPLLSIFQAPFFFPRLLLHFWNPSHRDQLFFPAPRV